MLNTCCNNSRKQGRHTLQIIKDTIVNCLVLLFEGVPEVTIDQSQGSMIDSVKEVNNKNIGSCSFVACLNQLKKSLQDQLTKDGIKFLDLSPNPHHAPIQKKDITKTASLTENKTKPVVQLKPTKTASNTTTSSAKTRQRASIATTTNLRILELRENEYQKEKRKQLTKKWQWSIHCKLE
jgi:hypothetical protein